MKTNPLIRSVDTLLRDLPRARTTGDLIADMDRRADRARRLLYASLFAAGLTCGIWATLVLIAP